MRIWLFTILIFTIILNATLIIRAKLISKVVDPEILLVNPLPNREPIPEVEPLKKQAPFPKFTQIEHYRKINEDSVFADVLGHSKGEPFGTAFGRSTSVHETAHGIHNEVRNEYNRLGKPRANAFYFLEGRAVIVEEPKIRKSHANKFVPEKLRSYRWKLYMAGQMEWDDTPLYLCDEWVAYILGGMCGIDDVKNGRHKGGWTDGVSGCLDFSIYSLGLCMAIREGDPVYWRENQQYKAFMHYALHQACRTFMEGRNMKEFRWDDQENLLRELRTNPAAEGMRKLLRDEFDGAWLVD